MPMDPLGEAGARADGVIQHILGDEGAAALLDADQAAARQFFQRAAHGVAIDAEAGREFRLGWQAGTRRIVGAADLLVQGFDDLPPQREAGLASLGTVRHRRAPGHTAGRQGCLGCRLTRWLLRRRPPRGGPSLPRPGPNGSLRRGSGGDRAA